MTNPKGIALTILLLYSLIFIVGCNLRPKQGFQMQASGQTTGSISDKDLLMKVEAFASDDDAVSAKAQHDLEQYSREKLISDLTRLYVECAPRDRNRILIAFTLCMFNHEYAANRAIVLASLTRNSGADNFFGDWAVDLVRRLYVGDDKSLLTNLLDAADWADGAAGEELASCYGKALTSDPETFLHTLCSKPKNTRLRVAELIKYFAINNGEVEPIKAKLRSAPTKSDLHSCAQEVVAVFQAK